jgi:lipopolysaccharide transport protein LptA
MIRVTMLKIFTLLVFCFITLNAEENYLNIKAMHFDADQQKDILNFSGDVKMTKNNDVLICQKLVINTESSKENPNKKVPVKYKATGDVSFEINTKDNLLKGKGDVIFYFPKEQRYLILGNGFLEDTKEGKTIVAEKIYIDELTGQTKIDGGENKPIKFRLRLNENKDTNTTNETKDSMKTDVETNTTQESNETIKGTK